MSEGQSQWKQDFYNAAPEIRLKDPLSHFLGAMDIDQELVFHFADAVKLAGHACPSVAGAYMVTAKALKALYPDQTPVRGDIKVTIKGKPDDLAYGPISQVIALITGAAPETGFKGLGGRFVRQNKLVFDREDFAFNTFIFERTDTGKTVKLIFNPQALPGNPRIGELMALMLSNKATDQQKEEFIGLWQSNVKKILLESDSYPGLFEITQET